MIFSVNQLYLPVQKQCIYTLTKENETIRFIKGILHWKEL